MITWNGRERSACGRERDLVPYDLPLKAANNAGPLAVTLVWLFLTQKEVLYPKYLKFRAGLPVRVLTKIRIKCVCRLLQDCYGQEQIGNVG